MALDLLAFGAHPDDIEIGLGGVVARHAAEGYRIGLCDLTRGELATNGAPEERLEEAEAAGRLLGVAWRVNLGWPDGDLAPTAERVAQAVALIRRWQPRTVALPYWQDRHPDHVAASHLLSLAAFRSGLRRYTPESEAWCPQFVCYYFINDACSPSFVVDVSDYYDIKRRALACHRTQFERAGTLETRLNSPRFLQLVESRDAQFGARVGVAFAEGLVVKEPLVRQHVFRQELETSSLESFPRL